MAKLNTADIGFEDQIWKAADKMCGNLDAYSCAPFRERHKKSDNLPIIAVH